MKATINFLGRVLCTLMLCFGLVFSSCANGSFGAEAQGSLEILGPVIISIDKIDATTATFTGRLNVAASDHSVSQVTVYYSDAEAFNIDTAESVSLKTSKGGKNFTITLTDLKHNTKYKYCIVVEVNSVKTYGDVLEFTTPYLKIINPYEGIDFATAKIVKSISHEHITTALAWQKAYNRGIRHFPALDYSPATPRFPASNFYCRIVDGQEVYIEYQDWKSVPDGIFTLENKTLRGGIGSFTDIDGNIINTDDLPQVPNNEHPTFTKDLKTTSNFLNHFNVLGNMWGEAGWGNNNGNTSQRASHPICDLSNMNNFLIATNQYWQGKAFATINHCSSYAVAEELIKSSLGQLPMGFELFNQYFSRSINQRFRDTYDKLLRNGIKLYAVAAVDWQGIIETARTAEDYINHKYDSIEDRGCNVLYVPDNYESLPPNDFVRYNNKSYPNLHGSVYTKAEAGLDCYIQGKFFASGLGNHRITKLNITGQKATFSVDGNPTTLKAITSKGENKVSSNTIEISIDTGITYVRFEAYYDKDTVKDFIFTQPIYFERK